MSIIIVLTSLAEENNATFSFAAALAKNVNARLQLLHVYGIPVVMNDAAFPVIPFGEIQKGVEDRMLKKREQLQSLFPDVIIEAESRIGDVTDEVKEACKEVNLFAIVMGSRGEKSVSFFGSTTMSVIRNATCPVLVIPESYSGTGVSKIVFASDLDTTKIPVAQIINLVQKFSAELHIVHVYEKTKDALSPDKLMMELSIIDPVFHAVQDEEIEHGVQQYVTEIGADMLMILPHEHSLLERFFFKLHTSDLVHHSSIPVLCLNE